MPLTEIQTQNSKARERAQKLADGEQQGLCRNRRRAASNPFSHEIVRADGSDITHWDRILGAATVNDHPTSSPCTAGAVRKRVSCAIKTVMT